ncbi:hypothetical protein HT031_006000 [Scenedesmus sp. PABB004]|nr:hypothetical protein HT031_006000 [Scenedesmus sp. PABB004]
MASEDFDEGALYSDDHDTASSEPDEPEAGASGGGGGAKAERGVAIGASSASHASSTLRASFGDDELRVGSIPTASPPVDVPAMRPARRAAMAASMQAPRAQPTHRLGTSAPIAIPNMMNRWRSDGGKPGAGPAGEGAATFVPPHQLSRQDDFQFSFNGASPSATLKRERLRTRNAILRSTGFLEPGAGGGEGGGGGGGAGAAASAALPVPRGAGSGGGDGGGGGGSLPRTPVVLAAGGLTAALSTIGEA